MNLTSKLSAVALAGLVAVGAVATPVLADGFNDRSKLFDQSYIITQLRYDGINAIAADQVTDSTFRATVVTTDGTQVFEFFDKDSLQQVRQ